MPQSIALNVPEPPGYYIHTFGCQMNDYDSSRVERMLAGLGYAAVSDPSDADVIFINTCSVRKKPEQKLYSLVGRFRALKNERPKLKIIVAGCVAQRLGKRLLSQFDHLDLVLGTRAVSMTARLLEQVIRTGERIAFLPEEEPPREEPFTEESLLPVKRSVTGSVTIMQGCNNFCSYCIVPYVRGRERSRPPEDIINEIRALTRAGVREILLLGQNVNSYGKGLEPRTNFVELLRRIAGETDLLRIRFTTSHPKDITDELIQCFAHMPTLCRHLHLPFQSGSDRILALMNRSYTSAHYRERIARLRDACPDIALGSDAITGFPGETEYDFQETMKLIEEIRFDGLFSFRYSDRSPARAADFPDKVDDAVSARRLIELQELQTAVTLEKNRAEVGHIREILVEGPGGKGEPGRLMGRTTHHRIVHFDGPEDLVGKLAQVEILSALFHSLGGGPTKVVP